jgi:hypothetical protein
VLTEEPIGAEQAFQRSIVMATRGRIGSPANFFFWGQTGFIREDPLNLKKWQISTLAVITFQNVRQLSATLYKFFIYQPKPPERTSFRANCHNRHNYFWLGFAFDFIRRLWKTHFSPVLRIFD